MMGGTIPDPDWAEIFRIDFCGKPTTVTVRFRKVCPRCHEEELVEPSLFGMCKRCENGALSCT